MMEVKLPKSAQSFKKDLEVVGTNGVYPSSGKVINPMQKGILMKHTKIEIGENLLLEKSMK